MKVLASGFLLVAIVALVLGGWIGYRATSREPDVCFGFERSQVVGIMCMDPEKGVRTFRAVRVGNDGIRSDP